MPEIDVFNLPVFPVADLFPLIPQDELAELADDIAENGLQEPIVIAQINDEWVLVDGRNRLAACKLAGVIPHTRILESDPTAYVLSANVHRRHLTKGQQAMATALAYPDKEKGGRGKKSVLNTEFNGASSGYLAHARFVLRNCRDKAVEVLRNSKYPLTVAYEEAQAIVEKQRIAEEERQRQLAALAILREEFSDLAALVDDQRLGLPEAIAAGDQRREAARLEQERIQREEEEKAFIAMEQERRRQEEEERKLADEERAKREAERQAKANYEANRAAFHNALSQLFYGAGIVHNPADCVDPTKWKGTWSAFQGRYNHSIQEFRDRLECLKKNIPFILKTLESMRDE
jgi:hypothetical protein